MKLVVLAVAGLTILTPSVDAWAGRPSHPSSAGGSGSATSSNRRLLFQSAAAGSIAVVSTATTALPAVAAQPPFSPAPHSLDNKVILITGANTGLGLESAKRLAAAGAEIVLTSRSAAKGQQAVQAVQDYLSEKGVVNDKVLSLPLDLCDLDNVKAFPKLLEGKLNGKPIDVLMNNAGVMAIPERVITKDGFEKTFQTNHLGHFVLTSKLAPMLSKDARIINVASEAWQFAAKGLELDNLNGEKEYGPWSSYGQSKLANILFTKELQRRAEEAGRSWTAVSLHPGAVQTDLGRYIVGEEKWNAMKETGKMSLTDKLLLVPLTKLTKTVEDGASTQVFLAANESGSDAGGKYYIDCKPVNLKGAATDMDKAKELWSISEKLTGTQFAI